MDMIFMFNPNNPIYYCLLMGDLIVLLPPIPERLTISKLAEFGVLQKNKWKT